MATKTIYPSGNVSVIRWNEKDYIHVMTISNGEVIEPVVYIKGETEIPVTELQFFSVVLAVTHEKQVDDTDEINGSDGTFYLALID